MRIKEVEERTGLSAKAIRLYESKGLLHVARESENDYRDYTEEDVKRLKMIAFLREMDISIQGIKDWADGKLSLQDLMRFVSGQADDAQQSQHLRGEMAEEILRLLKADPEMDLLEAMEDIQTLRELKQEIKKAGEEIRGNLVLPVLTTVIALGPIGWTVIHILMNRTKYALISFGLSILALLLVFFQWSNYLHVAKEKRIKSGCLPTLLVAASALGIVFGLICFVAICQEALFVSDPQSLMLFRYPWINILILAPIAEIFLALNLRRESAKEDAGVSLSFKQRVISWVLLITLNGALLYGCLTSVSVCDRNGFTRHSFFNPAGKYYSIDEIEHVEAGFYGNSIPILSGHDSGDFYYKITFSDGHTENWAQGSPADDDTDPWQALLELDAWLMSMDIEKITSDKNRDKAFYDQQTLDMCDAILNQK